VFYKGCATEVLELLSTLATLPKEGAVMMARQVYVSALVFLIAACASAPARLPRWTPLTEADYPPVSKRLGEEGRVLVEFHLNEQRQPFDLAIPEANDSYRLKNGALKVVRGLKFDPSDKSRPNRKQTYRVTVVFCFSPDCKGAGPFPGTEAVMVRGPTPNPQTIMVTPVSHLAF
jgi:TonB family protein